jgi:magnesium chelatase family protein
VQARRALEVAAAGGHHLLLAGPPGCGKTLLASRLPGILPEASEAEALEAAAIASVSGRGLDPARWREVSRETHPAEGGRTAHSFVRLERR